MCRVSPMAARLRAASRRACVLVSGGSRSAGGGAWGAWWLPVTTPPRSAHAFHLENCGTGALPTGSASSLANRGSAWDTRTSDNRTGVARGRPFGAGCAPIRVGYRPVEMTGPPREYDDGGCTKVLNRRTSAAAVDPESRTVDGARVSRSLRMNVASGRERFSILTDG